MELNGKMIRLARRRVVLQAMLPKHFSAGPRAKLTISIALVLFILLRPSLESIPACSLRINMSSSSASPTPEELVRAA